jgi:tetratricopeptide (TPR) repeat protein
MCKSNIFLKPVFCVLLTICFSVSSAQDAAWYINKADEHLNNGNYDLAISNYSQAIKLNPGNIVYAYTGRGRAYDGKNQDDLAIQDFTKAISLDPGYTEAYIGRGDIYSKIEKYFQAIKDYSEAIRLDDTNTYLYVSRGIAYYMTGQYDLAIPDYTKAIIADPGNASNYTNRHMAYYNNNQPELAMEDITKAISLDPDNAGNYNNRGHCNNELGNFAEAAADFKSCLEKDPGYSLAYINIISPLIRLYRFAEAKNYYDQYKQKKLSSYLESETYQFYTSFISAIGQLADGKLKEAYALLQLAAEEYGTEIKVETKRGYIDMMFLAAYILEKTEQTGEAKIMYEQSLVIDPKQPDVEAALQRLEQKLTATRALDNTGPDITLISPSPTRGFDIETDDAKTQIIGKAKDPAGIMSVKINNVAARLEEDGLFISSAVLKSGANTITISATDKQGNTTNKSFTVNTSVGAVTPDIKPDQSLIPGGSPKYFALLIAAKDYDDPNIPDLQNPVKDAQELKNILESKYTFDTANIETLFNRSREDIMQAIVQRCNSLTENDNLIIFYAGHGIAEKDKFGDVDGYWIPSSAKKGLNASYISADDINKAIKRSNAKHILVIADACFSGAFTRELPAEASKEIKKQYSVTSRKVMASGNLEPVPDNSKFIYYLKQKLGQNTEKYLTAKELFDSFYKAILSNSENLPQYAAIRNVGDEGGEFIFIKK